MQGIDGLKPLSVTQEPIWLEQLRHPERVNAGFVLVTVRGVVTAESLSAACAAVCAAHPELRGLVVDHEQRFWIRVHSADAVFEFDEQPLPCAPGEESETARTWYFAHREATWDLTRRAPIRFHLLWHDSDRCTLLVAVHHIAFDGRSKFEFARQFTDVLREIRAGRDAASAAGSGTTPAPRPPADPPADELAAAVRLWQDADLQNFPGLVLPQPVGSGDTADVASTDRFELAPETCDRLALITKQADASFFTGLLANTAALLGRYGNDRMVLCIPADTSTAATRHQIGMQVNMVPCLVQVRPGATFRELVAGAAEALANVHRFRRIPFHLLIREMRQACGVDVGPGVFDRLGVSYPRGDVDFPEVPGIRLDWDFFAPNSTQSFELTLQLRRAGTGAFGRLDYFTSVFDAATADEFALEWRRMLDRALQAPDAQLIPKAVRHTGRPPLTRPADGNLAERVRANAHAEPDAPCLTMGPDSLPYSRAAELFDAWTDGTASGPGGGPGAAELLVPVRPCRADEALRHLAAPAPRPADEAGEAAVRYLQESFLLGHLAEADRIRGRRCTVVGGHAPGSAHFTGSLVRALAQGAEIRVPEPGAAAGLLDTLLKDSRDFVVEGGPEWLDLLAAALRSGIRPGPGQVTVMCPAERFLPTRERLELVRAGVRVVLCLEDPGAGPIAWARWEPDQEAPHRAPLLSRTAREWEPVALAPDGRELPHRTPGTLALRHVAGGTPLITAFRGWTDGEGGLCFLGLESRTVARGGRLLDHAEAERRVAMLPGVRDAVVVVPETTGRPVPAVLLVLDGSDHSTPDRVWRRRVLRVWPAGLTAPASVVTAPELPRTWAGEPDRDAVRTLCQS
jgi:hypothetical protein